LGERFGTTRNSDQCKERVVEFFRVANIGPGIVADLGDNGRVEASDFS